MLFLSPLCKRNIFRKRQKSGHFHKEGMFRLRLLKSVLLPYFQKAFYLDFKTDVT